MSPLTPSDKDVSPALAKIGLSEDDVILSHSIHFAWGYPDYVQQAFLVLRNLECEFIPKDFERELTWSQLRKALEIADSPSTRFLVAGCADTPQNVLDYLSRGSERDVTCHVAEHPNVHTATLCRLAKHPEPSVRIAVSENERTPEGALLFLTFDENPDVRYVMAENAKMPHTILEVLSNDQNPYVATRAQTSLNRLSTGEVLIGTFSRVARRRIHRASAQ